MSSYLFCLFSVVHRRYTMDQLSIILITCISYTFALSISENVIFERVNEVSTSHSRWLVTFVHDLKPYEHFINKINDDLNSVDEILRAISKFYDSQNKTGYVYTYDSLHKDVHMINDTLWSIKDNFEDYRSMRSNDKRNKRSLLPIIGQISSVLFGTLTEDDLNKINNNVRLLHENQVNIIHDLEQSMTLLNLSRVQISENRRAIIDVVICIRKLHMKMSKIKEQLSLKITDLEQFVSSYFQFKLIIEEIKQASQDAMLYLGNLRNEINHLTLNKLSPSTISPKDLKMLLTDIREHIPETFKLPVNPAENIWYYYHTLFCNTYLSDQIVIVLDIPLLDVRSTFDIYKIYNLPLPLHNVTLKSQQSLNMVAQYKLDADALMIDKTKTKYALLSIDEFKQCNNKQLNYCQLMNALYPVNLSKSCTVALFLKRGKNIKHYCENTVRLDTRLPYVKYIGFHKWAVAVNDVVDLTINCKDNVTVVSIKPPLSVISINSDCKVSSDYFNFGPYYEYRSELSRSNSLNYTVIVQPLSDLSLWTNLSEHIPNSTSLELPDELTRLQSIPMNTFINHVRGYHKFNVNNESTFNWTYAIISFIIIIIAVCMLCFLYYYKRILIKQRLVDCCGVGIAGADAPGGDVSVSSYVDEDVRNAPGRQITSTPDRGEAIMASLLRRDAQRPICI